MNVRCVTIGRLELAWWGWSSLVCFMSLSGPYRWALSIGPLDVRWRNAGVQS